MAAVADPAAPSGAFPHWGFVADRHCIGTTVGQTGSYQVCHKGKCVTHPTPPIPAGQPVPDLILWGRSQFKGKNNPHSYWVKVHWHPEHGAVPATELKMTHSRTLRDAAHAFVIGNVYKGWRVRPTGSVRSWTSIERLGRRPVIRPRN